MSERYYALTVTLEQPINDEDAEGLIEAIKHLRGVLTVAPHVADVQTHWAQETARHELGAKLWAVLYPPVTKERHS